MSDIEILNPGDGEAVIRIGGRVDFASTARLWEELGVEIDRVGAGRVVLDLSAVEAIDSSGVALIRALEDRLARRDRELGLVGASETIERFLQHARKGLPPPPPAAALDFVSSAGAWARAHARNAWEMVAFLGLVLVAGPTAVVKRRPLPSLDQFLHQLERAGAEAVTLVVGLSFLMGVITALNFVRGLEDFNATSFLAGVVAVSLTRELGPLLTGIVLAGRSGAGLAAELGTMRVGQEIDALESMGFDVVTYLVLPRIGGLLLAGPLLTALADAAGLAGGALIGNTHLDMAVLGFLTEAGDGLTLGDLGIGLVKGFAFAAVVGVVGCHKGFRVVRAPESVGRQTTSAVVTSILLILVVDAALTSVLQMHGW